MSSRSQYDLQRDHRDGADTRFLTATRTNCWTAGIVVSLLSANVEGSHSTLSTMTVSSGFSGTSGGTVRLLHLGVCWSRSTCSSQNPVIWHG